MYGAIIGDIVGSRFEFNSNRSKDFELFVPASRFTDDSVLTVAVAETLLKYDKITDENQFKRDLVSAFHKYGREYIGCGFGGRFLTWIINCETQPYNSFGNGSAMRVSPVAWYADSLEETEYIAKLTAEVTHNHPEGIKGAQSVAGAIWLARQGKSKKEIKEYAEIKYGYDLNFSLNDLSDEKHFFDLSCQVTVPIALKCFLEAKDYMDTVRKAVWVGGDVDTIASIAGSVAEAYYGIDDYSKDMVRIKLDKNLYAIVEEFDKKYIRIN